MSAKIDSSKAWIESKQAAIDELRKLIELETQHDLLKQIIAITGDKQFTAEEMLSAIEREDEYGKQLIKIYQLRESFKSEALSQKKQDSRTITPVTETKGDETSSLQNRKKKVPKDPNLLLIRPDTNYPPSSSYVTSFSYPASVNIKQRAAGNTQRVWNTTDLYGNRANRISVQNALQNNSVDLVLHYDHGQPDVVFGQNNGGRERAIDLINAGNLNGKALSTVSCYSASILGPAACLQGARAYLGYSNAIWAPDQGQFTNIFIEAANAANNELLNGKTFQEAHKKGRDTYWLKFQDLILMSTTVSNPIQFVHILWAAGFLLWNKECFVVLGDLNTHF